MRKTAVFVAIMLLLFLLQCVPKEKQSYGLSGKEKETMQAVRKFIASNWQNTIRNNPKDTGTLIGLPFPYTVL